MRYINPFDLLFSDINDLSELNPISLSKAKRRLLADLELSDSLSIKLNGYELNKSDCLRVIDDLDNNEKKEFHFFIYKNTFLNSFLSNGDLSFFSKFKVESIFKDKDFLDFISPYFSFQYNKSLCDNFKSWNYENVKIILSLSPIVSDSFLEKCYVSTYSLLKSTDEEISALNKSLLEKNVQEVKSDYIDIDDRILKIVNVPLLNLLPIYFQNIRNQIALSIRSIARDLNNKPFELFILSFNVISIAYNIETDANSKRTITKGYYTIKSNYADATIEIDLINQLKPIPINSPSIPKPKKEYVLINKIVSNPIVYGILYALAYFIFSMLGILFSYSDFVIDHKENKKVVYYLFLAFLIALGGDHKEVIKQLSLPRLIIALYFITSLFSTEINLDIALRYMFMAFAIEALILIFFHSISKTPSKWISVITATALYILMLVQCLIPSSNTEYSNLFSSNNLSTENIDDTSSSIPYVEPNNDRNSSDNTPSSTPEYYYVNIENGNINDCSKIHPKFDKNSSSLLAVTCGSSSDVALKLFESNSNICIRYVYIHKNSTFLIKNIPQGIYYYKLSFGEKWGLKSDIVDCEGRFSLNAKFKKSDKLLDYTIQYNQDGSYDEPSYSLKLDITKQNEDESNSTINNEITENDFFNE